MTPALWGDYLSKKRVSYTSTVGVKKEREEEPKGTPAVGDVMQICGEVAWPEVPPHASPPPLFLCSDTAAPQGNNLLALSTPGIQNRGA